MKKILFLLIVIFGTINIVNAQTIASDPSSYYCPEGSSNNRVFNDLRYYGCSGNIYKGVTFYNNANFNVNYNMDLSFMLLAPRNKGDSFINVKANGIGCFMTSFNTDVSQTNQADLTAYQVVCLNVPYQSTTPYLTLETTTTNKINQWLAFGREISVSANNKDDITNTYLSNILNKINSQSTSINNINTNITNQTNQQHQDAQNINNSITSNDVTGNNSSSSLTSIGNTFSSQEDFLLNLLTIPYTLWTSILNVFSDTCAPLDVGTIFNYHLVFPCIELNQFLGGIYATIIDVIFTAIIYSAFIRRVMKYFRELLTLDDHALVTGGVKLW